VFIGSVSVAYLDRDGRPNVFQLVALPFLLMLHQITTIYAAALLAILIVIDLRYRNFLRFWCFSVIALLASIPLGLFTWRQLGQFSDVLVEVSWIQPLGTLDALWTMLRSLVPALGQNWVALFAVGVIAVSPRYRPRGAGSSLVWILAGAAIGGSAIVLLINQRIPLIEDYILSFLAVEAMVIVSLAIVPLLYTKPWIGVLIAANAGVYVASNGAGVAHDRGLLQDADMVAQLVAECPQTRIHAGSRLPARGPDPVRVIAPPQSEQIALQGLAAADGLTLLPLGPDTPGACPVVYWTEYRAPKAHEIEEHHGDIVSAANDYAGFGLDGSSIAHAKAIRLSSPFAIGLIVSPAR